LEATTEPESLLGDPAQQRLRLLRSVPAFQALPERVLGRLAAQVVDEPYPQGAVVLDEGAAADRLFLIAEGEVLVSISNGAQQVPLCRLGEGELFGEIGLLAPLRQRSARVTALRPLLLATLARRHFQAFVESHPEARAGLQAAAEQALVASLLRRASPFRGLKPEVLRQLAARLEVRAFTAGQTIFRQGDPGDVCYLVEAGRLEVLKQEGGSQRLVATLGSGEIVGEAALLTHATRDASLRALEDVRLLALRRSHLLEVVRAQGREVVALAQLRDRPARAAGVVVHTRATPDAASIAVLEDPSRPGVYEQLSAPGVFVWEQLDGSRTVEEIQAACPERFPGVSEDEVQALVARLLAAGFARGKQMRADVTAALRPIGLVQRLLRLFQTR
jgi:CRP-like cAMP-binding protein